MCGIAGVVGHDAEKFIQAVIDALVHRGPDEEGTRAFTGAALGARRLKIIDLVSGRQPISNEDGRFHIVFNGEIYNYREIRENLLRRGHRFTTQTDTECVLHLYEEEGPSCLRELKGMFAFGIWDDREKELFLARDRFGKKPLYYTQAEGRFAFASEIKALWAAGLFRPELDPVALGQYLVLQYVPGPRTLFRGVFKLPPATWMRVGRDGIRTQRYWNLEEEMHAVSRHSSSELGAMRKLLREAVQRRMVADVPVGVLLSGGLDSTGIVAVLTRWCGVRPKTFTVGYDPPSAGDERAHARRVAEFYGTDHQELVIRPNPASQLPHLVWHLDEPLADEAALPTLLLCQQASKKVTVLLTGEGSDEVFGGYPRYLLGWLADGWPLGSRFPFAVAPSLWAGLGAPAGMVRALEKLARAPQDPWERNLLWAANFSPEEAVALAEDRVVAEAARGLGEEIRTRANDWGNDPFRRLQRADVDTWLVDNILMKLDKASMAASVEVRAPYLDHDLAGFALGAPVEHRWGIPRLKGLLRRALWDILPPETRTRRKQPFRVPVARWLRTSMRSMVLEFLCTPGARIGSLLRMKEVRRIVQEHLAGARNHHQKIWNLLCLELWMRVFLDRSLDPGSCTSCHEGMPPPAPKRRFLTLTLDYPPSHGGIQRVAEKLSEALGEENRAVVAPWEPRCEAYDHGSGIPAIRVPEYIPMVPSRWRSVAFCLRALPIVLWKSMTLRPEAVLCIHPYVAPLAYALLRLAGIPYVVIAHALEVMDPRIHWALRPFLQQAARLLAVSRYTARYLEAHAMTSRAACVISWGADVPADQELPAVATGRAAMGLPQRGVLLSVARLARADRYKGIDMAIQAFPGVKARLPEVVYLVVGDGDDRPHLERLARELGVDGSVRFLGNRTDKEVRRLFRLCDVFVQPNREEVEEGAVRAEGFGIVFLEAGAAGKPVVGGRSGGVPDAVMEGVTGLLVDPNDPRAIADAICRILEDRELAERLGRQGRERVERELNWENVGRQVRQILEEVIRERRRA